MRLWSEERSRRPPCDVCLDRLSNADNSVEREEIDNDKATSFPSTIDVNDDAQVVYIIYLNGDLVLFENAVKLFLGLQSDQDTFGGGNTSTITPRRR